MSIFENLQHLSPDTKALIAIVLVCWIFSEFRHRTRRRADTAVIHRLRSAATGGDRALLETQRPPGRAYGAALAAGKAIVHGREAGLYFSTVLQNSGGLAAEDIQVTAALGTHTMRVVSAPHRLQVAARMAPIELRLPFGLLSFDDVQRYLQAGIPLRLQIAYRDASRNVHLLEECFTFAHSPAEQHDHHARWLSQEGACRS
ncbi:MAG: hypothetical protein M3Z20_16670 [Chloroflexota bacterium]|nr:hypothetical protein [Chloroflexota bacterium]